MNKFNILTTSGKCYIFESDVKLSDLVHDIVRNEFIFIGDDMVLICNKIECVKKAN